MPNEHTHSSPIRIFIAYSKHDKSFLDELLKHFFPAIRNKTIAVFYDGVIEAGKEWDKAIKDNLHNSDIILLLVSANFIATDYCYDEEMTAAIALHEQDKAQVIPIMLSPFDFEDMPFAKLNFLPEKAKPISNYLNNHHQAYTEIVLALKKGNYPIALQRRQAKAAAEQAAKEQAEQEAAAKEKAEKQEHTFLDHYQQGNKAFKQEKWEEALEYYNEAQKLHQNGYTPTRETIRAKIDDCNEEINAADYLKRADKCEQQQNYAEAIKQLQAAIKLKPELSETLNPRIKQLQDKAAKEEAKREKEEKAKREGYIETAFGLNLVMKPVEGGTFMMGSSKGLDREKPPHTVTVGDFYMAAYPITQAQWQAVMGNNPSHFKGDDLPVETVSWHDAQDFLEKLSRQTGKAYRLPTEAEWEYAARGGKQRKGYQYAGSDNIEEVAWYSENSGKKTQPVGQKKPNELGLYDMSGNVWEWCNDWYDENYYANSPQDNPRGAVLGSDRVLRGGSWFGNPQSCRVAYRDNYTPGPWINFIGFRLVASQ